MPGNRKQLTPITPKLTNSTDQLGGDISPLRQSMNHATKRLIQRISLDPVAIPTDLAERKGELVDFLLASTHT